MPCRVPPASFVHAARIVREQSIATAPKRRARVKLPMCARRSSAGPSADVSDAVEYLGLVPQMSLPEKLFRNAARLACGVVPASCVSTSADDPLASTAIGTELPPEGGALVEQARLPAGRAGGARPGGASR